MSWYVICDICGGRYLSHEMSKLTTYTGKGNLIVCPNDNDKINPRLIPFKPRVEKPVPFSRGKYPSGTQSQSPVDFDTEDWQGNSRNP